jgi:regulatory protein
MDQPKPGRSRRAAPGGPASAAGAESQSPPPGRRRATSPPRRVLDPKAARQAAVDLLARKAWSARELAQRLRRRGAPAEVARAVVGELEARGYLDDAAYARWWAEARAQGRRVGSARLRRELGAKGIRPELAEAAIAGAFERVPELARAVEAGRRRLPALRRRRPERAGQRLRDYLLRRGYAPAVVRAALRELIGAPAAEPVAPDGEEGG